MSVETMTLRKAGGFSLIEVMVAMAIMLVSLGALFGMFSVAVGQNANQGEAGTRTTEYAQDKMEQLLALNFTDGTTNAASPNYPPTGIGKGLGGNMAANATVGGTTPGVPVTQYVDYVTSAGVVQTSSSGAFYIRQWSIATDSVHVDGSSLPTLKIITVRVSALKALGPGAAPFTILVSYKSRTT